MKNSTVMAGLLVAAAFALAACEPDKDDAGAGADLCAVTGRDAVRLNLTDTAFDAASGTLTVAAHYAGMTDKFLRNGAQPFWQHNALKDFSMTYVYGSRTVTAQMADGRTIEAPLKIVFNTDSAFMGTAAFNELGVEMDIDRVGGGTPYSRVSVRQISTPMSDVQAVAVSIIDTLTQVRAAHNLRDPGDGKAAMACKREETLPAGKSAPDVKAVTVDFRR